MRLSILLLTALILMTIPRHATTAPRNNIYIEHGLVSDLHPHAEHLDPNLVNPWGIASGPATPFWVSDNGTGVSTLYDTAGNPFPVGNPLVVTIPPPLGGTPPAAPTGVVFNGSTTSLLLAPGAPALFIFATEDGTISGWNLSVDLHNAILKATTAGAVYKGLAIGNNGSGNFLYATNFSAGTIDVFNGTFGQTSLAGSFSDAALAAAGFAPFGIRNIHNTLYVTYAKRAGKDDVAGPGNGYVDVFDLNGNFVQRLISKAVLNSPWGLTLATANFGDLSNTLLVGNFGDGTINAFDLATGAPRGTILEPSGRPMVIQGLWGLLFGNGGLGGELGVLYFTAGIPGDGEVEDHGLFGQIRPQHP